ncbi:MAG: hypothetical protein HGA45_26340 [Chloroflexales bacterium]|nr:hypothetical protein [Chloroflexales bacterium]
MNNLRRGAVVSLMALIALAFGISKPALAYSNPPNTVQFTLEGCKNNGSITLPNADGNFVCPDPGTLGGNNTDYTTGNLGKGWNELDLVPHRLISQNGNSGSSITYNVIIAADSVTAGRIGYDAMTEPQIIRSPKLNAFSNASCQLTFGAQQLQSGVTGGADVVIYRELTITQASQTTCVIDWANRLAVGAAQYPGASLQSYMFERSDFSTGKRTISIPVREIKPQELRKTMAASQDASHIWNITKDPSPVSLNFPNTCLADGRQAEVTITVRWEKLAATPDGDITVVTNIYAKNPASRTITVQVSDAIRSGTTTLNTLSSGPVDVPANTEKLVLTHQLTVPEGTTDLNDIATATYTDEATGVPVPGTTTATASAVVQPSGITRNATATINDSEDITGSGLSYSADSFSGASGDFDNYSAGTPTNGEVSWTSEAQSGDNSVVFSKTVYVDQPVITDGSLDDTATLTGSDGYSASDTASVAIETHAEVTLRITKKIPNVLGAGESETFSFTVTGPNGYESLQSISFAQGDTEKYIEINGLQPGSYTVTETGSQSGKWSIPAQGKTIDIQLPTCADGVTFENTLTPATAKVKKVTEPTGGEAGWQFTLSGPGVTDEQQTTNDADFVAFDADLQEGSYTISEAPQEGYEFVSSSGCDFTVDYPADAGKVFECTYTNRQLGKIIIEKQTLPNGSTASFTFSGEIDTTLQDGGTDFKVVSAGEYTVSEESLDGWDLTAIECDDSDSTGSLASRAATFVVGVGETVKCTFTNTQRGSIVVVKNTVGGNGSFDFTSTSLSPDSFTLTTQNNTAQQSFTNLVPGTFDVAETEQEGWDLTSATCDDNSPIDNINVAPGETVTCTFTNTKRGTIIIKKIVKPTSSTTSFSFDATGTDYVDFSLQGGGENSQSLKAGSYTVKELVPLGWVLTGIGGSTDPNKPYNCTVNGSGGSTGAGDLNTQTASIDLKSGDTVTCVFENTGQGVTRTQGFWATHTPLADIAWFGGTKFGHTFPGVASTASIGDRLICGRPIDDLGKVLGGFWSDIAKLSTGSKRTALDQARMQLLQQLIAAELNASAFGSVPSSGSFAAWESALCGTNTATIKTAQQQAASFNSQGDSGTFTPGTSADSKYARSIANIPFWDIIKP